jgi:capsular polysaccharide biosynthesis protein
MSDQTLDLRGSLRILRRHVAAVGLTTVLGAVAGAGYVALNPPMYTSYALVALPASTRNMATQTLTASSNPVLAGAQPSVLPTVSLQTLRSRVQVTVPISGVLSINAQGNTAAQAQATANAVADSYIRYVGTAQSPGGALQARVLVAATTPAGTGLLTQLLVTAGLGTLLGIAIGSIGVLAVSRRARWLRERDDIADAIGVPVLASLPTAHPSNVSGWISFLERHEPAATDAWRWRNALHLLGVPDLTSAAVSFSGGFSLTVFSVSSDRRALALGPQLAVFAAAQGISTALVITPRQDVASAALQAACAASPSARRPGLRVAIADNRDPEQMDAALTVVVTVLGSRNPQVADVMHTDAAVLGVSAGAATAEQLARAATAVAADGRHIAGIIVADPDPADPTTGRLPQLARPAQMPIRMIGTATVTRR